MSTIPHLPLELILQIIASLITDPRSILPPSHSTTKTLLSLTRACRATYPIASNYLRQHCVYIDNDRRLRQLLHCVESTRSRTQLSERPGQVAGPATTAPRPLRPITTLYLAPFGRSLDDQPTAIWLRELFCLLRLTLLRLVVDLPLRSLYPADDHLDVRRTLRGAFEQLLVIEELVCVRDELFLDVLDAEWRRTSGHGVPETMVWATWPRLRRLALYNVDADEGFWANARVSGALETVVLTRADGLQDVCAKSAYLGDGDAGTHTAPEAYEQPPRPLKVVLVNVSNDHPDRLAGQAKWDEVDPVNVMSVMSYDVPRSFYGDEDPITLCQEWVKTAALRGEIWDWEGTLIKARRGASEASFAHAVNSEA